MAAPTPEQVGWATMVIGQINEQAEAWTIRRGLFRRVDQTATRATRAWAATMELARLLAEREHN